MSSSMLCIPIEESDAILDLACGHRMEPMSVVNQSQPF